MQCANPAPHTSNFCGQLAPPAATPAHPRVVYDTDFLLLDGLMGYGPELLSDVRALAKLIDEHERLGREHSALEASGAGQRKLQRAEDAWHAAGDRRAEASLALLDDNAGGPEATVRLTVHLRERVMYATPVSDWRPFSAAEAIERLRNGMPGADEDLGPALAYAMKHMPSATYDPAAAMALFEWNKARDEYVAAKAARDADDGADEAVTDRLHDAMCNALERWESLTPPSLEHLAEVMRASMQFVLRWSWQSPDCPRSMRDILDGGDFANQFAARYYLHVLRMAGVPSQALLTPPIAGLFPSFQPNYEGEPNEWRLQEQWNAHHGAVEPHESRIAELASWRAPVERFDSIHDKGAMASLWHHGVALHKRAATLVAEYEALGGRFSVHRGPGGGLGFGVALVRGCAEADAVLAEVNRNEPLLRAVMTFIERRDGILGDPPALAAE